MFVWLPEKPSTGKVNNWRKGQRDQNYQGFERKLSIHMKLQESKMEDGDQNKDKSRLR